VHRKDLATAYYAEQMNAVYTLTRNSIRIHFHIIPPAHTKASKVVSCIQYFPTKIMRKFVISAMSVNAQA
jgi:hypothetical protein